MDMVRTIHGLRSINQSITSLLTYDKTHMLTLNTELQYKKSIALGWVGWGRVWSQNSHLVAWVWSRLQYAFVQQISIKHSRKSACFMHNVVVIYRFSGNIGVSV